MSRVKSIAGAAIVAVLMLVAAAPSSARAQGVERARRTTSSYDQAYQIGFDRGYRGGFDRGAESRRNTGSNNPNDYKEYRSADDGYNKDVGSRDDYTLGYRSGFEQGFDDGYNGNQYGAQPGVARATVRPHSNGNGGPVLRRSPDAGPDPTDPNAVGSDPNDPSSAGAGGDPNDPYAGGDPNDPNAGAQAQGPARVGQNSTLVIELTTPITTEYSQEGDRFSARVVEPASFAGAIVDGYIGKLTRPGKVSGKGEIVLDFERITFPDGASEPLEAQVDEVLGYQRGTPAAGNNGPLDRAPWEHGKKRDRNDDIDAEAGDEGQIVGQSSRNRDVATVGGTAAAGAVLGGILGGGSGAAIGAAVGGAAGGGAVAASRGHEIDLEPGVQLRIRTGQGVNY